MLVLLTVTFGQSYAFSELALLAVSVFEQSVLEELLHFQPDQPCLSSVYGNIFYYLLK